MYQQYKVDSIYLNHNQIFIHPNLLLITNYQNLINKLLYSFFNVKLFFIIKSLIKNTSKLK